MSEEILSIKDVATRVTASKIWLGFPHYVVLGWALLISWQIYEFRNWRDTFLMTSDLRLDQTNRTLLDLTNAIHNLQEDARRNREDAIKTKMILELKFPRTARQVEDAIPGED